MNKSAKVFLTLFIILLLVSAAASFYRYMVLKKYDIVEDYFSAHPSLEIS